MQIRKKRYMFVEYSTLRQVKFSKLREVSDRIYVFVDRETEEIPFQLARQMQKMGRAIKWILVDEPERNMQPHLCFVMGRLHERTDEDIEFAVLSDATSYDSLIIFINNQKRKCLRVLPNRTNEYDLPKMDPTTMLLHEETESGMANRIDFEIDSSVPVASDRPVVSILAQKENYQNGNGSPDTELATLTESDTRELAERTVQRLIRSGNRPAELETLRHYITYSSSQTLDESQTDRIVTELQNSEAVKLDGGQVHYNF